ERGAGKQKGSCSVLLRPISHLVAITLALLPGMAISSNKSQKGLTVLPRYFYRRNDGSLLPRWKYVCFQQLNLQGQQLIDIVCCSASRLCNQTKIKLHIVQFPVEAIAVHQFGMRTGFAYHAF